jgi:hypothetical protein
LDPPKIEVRRLTYEVGGTEILTGVDALVPDGEITAVVGPSSWSARSPTAPSLPLATRSEKVRRASRSRTNGGIFIF